MVEYASTFFYILLSMLVILSIYLIISFGLVCFGSLKNRLMLCLSVFLPIYTILCIIAYYISNYFSGEGIDERFIFHIKMGLAGVDLFDYLPLILGVLLVIVFTGYLIYKLIRLNKKQKIHLNNILFVFLATILIFNPVCYKLIKIYSSRYIGSLFVEDMSNYYQELKKPNKEQNLDKKYIIVLYLESLEKAFYDNRLFEDLMPFLKKTTEENLTFTNIYQVAGTGFTIGGLVSSQCGKPLLSIGQSKSESYNGIWNSFLGDTYCLSDYLHDAGYTTYFIGGADLDFGNKKKFLRSHSFLEENLWGLKEFSTKLKNKNIPIGSYKSLWGFYDEIVLEQMLEIYGASDEKAYIVGLTLGVHHPGNLISPYCRSKFNKRSNDYLNILECTDDNLRKFVENIRNNPKAKDTLLVLASDHLAMNNPYIEQLQKLPARENLLTFIDFSSPKKEAISRKGSTLDTGATILDYLNSGDKSIGLGVSLLDAKKNTLVEHFLTETDATLRAWTSQIIGEDIKTNLYGDNLYFSQKEIKIGNASTNTFPIVLIYDTKSGKILEGAGDFSSHPLFEKNGYYTYYNYIINIIDAALEKNQNIFWLDKCDVIDSFFNDKLKLFNKKTSSLPLCYININNHSDDLELSYGDFNEPYIGKFEDLYKSSTKQEVNKYIMLTRMRDLILNPFLLQRP